MQDTSLKTENLNESRRYTKSSSFIMALIFTILCGITAASIGYFINYFTKGHFVESTEAVLDSEIRYIETIGVNTTPPKNAGRLYVYLNRDGSLPDYLSSSITRLTEGIIVFRYPKNERRYAAKIHTFSNNQKILIGTDITSISEKFQFMQWLGMASICFVMIVVFVAYIISVFVVSETNKIADTAHEIMDTGDLSRRLEVGSQWDDLGNMAIVLNMLLDRVEELMQGVRQVSDNIAHDLRTPLTRMRGKIESLKDSPKKEELLSEADHVLDTFNALLRISRIEAEKQKSQFEDTNLKELLEDVAEYYDPLTEEKNIKLISHLDELSIRGDRDLLFQAYANLIDNAIKFTPSDGKIEVALKKEKEKICIEISDTGAGIPEDEKKKIFNRFFRSAKCRSTSGTGLGLSLVSAVIDLHNGKIEVENTNPGLKIITTF